MKHNNEDQIIFNKYGDPIIVLFGDYARIAGYCIVADDDSGKTVYSYKSGRIYVDNEWISEAP